MLTALSLLASVWIVTMYWWLVRTGETAPLNLANAVGAIPVLAVEVIAHTWAPMVLTAAFGLTGLLGLIKEHRS